MIDSKAIHNVLSVFVPLIQDHRQQSTKPYVLGLSGLQGSGKSTWATALSKALIAQHGLKTRVLSLDDLYLDHADLNALRQIHSGNKLLQSRGQPGTHDEALARDFFSKLRAFNTTQDSTSVIGWPSYDKSLHSGQGGRVPIDEWERLPLSEGLDVLIFEGWCLGFKPLTDAQVQTRWEQDNAAEKDEKVETENPGPTKTLNDHGLDHLLLINKNLERYCGSFTGPQHFDGFLHLSSTRLVHVYDWRMDQERALRKHKPGMTDEQVIEFVRGYTPAYELFLGRLQQENFFKGLEGGDASKKHIQIVLNESREVVQVRELE